MLLNSDWIEFLFFVLIFLRGEETKKNQFEEASAQMKKIDGILCQVNLQIKSLAPFPEFHPKRKVEEFRINIIKYI